MKEVGNKSGRMTVQVDAETHQLLETYSNLTGIPLGKVAGRAVKEWMAVTGRVQLEVMTGQKYTESLQVPVEAKPSAGPVSAAPGAPGMAH